MISWRTLLALYLVNLVVLTGVAAFQQAPGYMDAEYYLAGGMRLAEGHGFSEVFLWNYLGDPTGLPRPSHAYWMPLASLLAAPGLVLTGTTDFSAGRILFLLVGAAAAPMAAGLAWSWSQTYSQAWLAGLLGIFSGFFLPRLPTTDTFGLVMVIGAAFLWSAGSAWRGRWSGWLCLGAASGGMHLARADGLLWLLFALILGALWDYGQPSRSWRRAVSAIGLTAAGYLVVMSPWLLRNLSEFGVPLAPGAGTALWQTGYNDLFHYPASDITFARWLSAGLGAAVSARWVAFQFNLQTVAVVQGSIVLLPLMIWGLWRHRSDIRVGVGVAMWAVIFLAMTAAFPFSGARGGFFHSGAALQPLLWAAVPAGLEGFLELGQRLRNWTRIRQARVVIGGILVMGAFLVSLGALARIVIGSDPALPIWNQGFLTMTAVSEALEEQGITPCVVIMLNNPPALYVASGRPGIVIPDGGLEPLLAASRRYGAEILLLDPGNPELKELYDHPNSQSQVEYLGTVADTRIFRIAAP